MMFDDRGAPRLSASDLMRFMGCAHATRLDFACLSNEPGAPEPTTDSADATLLQARGDAHEEAHLEGLKTGARQVIEIPRMDLEAAVNATRAALADGPDVVFRGALAGGAWGGFSDFLERVDRPSALGAFSYEVADTKLKRKVTPGHALQLVLYSDLLAQMQGAAPEFAHVELGSGERETIRLDEVSSYARTARARLEAFVAAPPKTRPIPCAACLLCRWRDHCDAVWKAGDSLYRVAGITRVQVARLEAAGIATMEALSAQNCRVPKLADGTLARLRVQARLQHARKTSAPTVELKSPEPSKGFDLLPRPATGDLFYDIEGDPHYEQDKTLGLEYLHGVWDGAVFTAFWAHDRAEEKAALEALFRFFSAHLARFPDARIYHYAPYEITALRRLTALHGTGEARLDRWLREKRFIDLYAVVRGGITASEPSYSIKHLEVFYGVERSGEVKTAGGSVVAYEAWRESCDREILAKIEDYNRIDCVSTEKLRDWLVALRPDAPWPAMSPAAAEQEAEADAALAALRVKLSVADLPEGRAKLLEDLALFHTREKKPAAWAVFDACTKSPEALEDDLDCLAGLVATGPQRPVKRSNERDYRFAAQETKIRHGRKALFAKAEGFGTAEVTAFDRTTRRLTLKMGTKRGDLPDQLDLLPEFALNTAPIEQALARVIEDQCGARSMRAADDLLARNVPRFNGKSPLPLGPGTEPVAGLIAVVHALDDSVLPVQGPPGTGKTFATARAILSLVRAGKRVAVASNSHAAIRNVLMGCIDALREDDADLAVEDLSLAHKVSAGDEGPPEGYEAIESCFANDAAPLSRADVVGGTAWMFSRPEFQGAFDVLFVDEVGQVSLANLLAMSTAARSVVLVGDPRQLPQVIQGAHPHPADLSCLDWLLGDATTVPPVRGVFLPVSRRMHPDLCTFASEQFYAGRLAAHPSTAARRVQAPGLPQAGAFRVPVPHQGRAQDCEEEAAAIAAVIDQLTMGTWTDAAGTRPLHRSDIIVVAPYTAQVNRLTEALPGVRVGTVDKFQGQEAPVALVSMTASSAEETSRGLDFLLSRERMNVAISRGKALSLVFASPALTSTSVSTLAQMRLVNALCALPELCLTFCVMKETAA